VIQQGTELNHQSMITSSQLLELGLHGTAGSKSRRQRLCDKLNIGTANAKTLRFKLMIYGYHFDMIHELVKEI
jgi:ribonuclease M5